MKNDIFPASKAPLLLAVALASCVKMSEPSQDGAPLSLRRLNFDITVTRDGATKGDMGNMVDAADLLAQMDTRRPFSLIAIEEESGDLSVSQFVEYCLHGDEQKSRTSTRLDSVSCACRHDSHTGKDSSDGVTNSDKYSIFLKVLTSVEV